MSIPAIENEKISSRDPLDEISRFSQRRMISRSNFVWSFFFFFILKDAFIEDSTV